jgi:hypothetical protein
MESVKRSRASLTVALLVVVSCSGSGDPTPTTVVTLAPAPTPAPTPTPTPSPTTKSCTLATQDDCGRSGCCRAGGTLEFEDEIYEAQEALKVSWPEAFNDDGSLDVDEVEYTEALAKKITEMTGLCARGGGGRTSISRDEVAIKRNNSMSQNVDVILGAKNTPHIGGVYTCRPASF